MTWRKLRECIEKGKARRNPAGQSTVEFALIVWPFFLLLLATADYAQFYFYEHSLRYALTVAGRYATPGSVITTNSVPNGYGATTDCPIRSSYQPSQWISRCESIRLRFSNNCAMSLPLDTLKMCSWRPNTPNVTNVGPGLAGDFVKLKVTYRLKLITPVGSLLSSNGEYNINVSAIFLNEPSGLFVLYTNYYTGENPWP